MTSSRRARSFEDVFERSQALTSELAPLARPLVSDSDLDPLIARIGQARYVLLGEASHGTHEFYDWRARLTRRLIQEKGFSFIGVEGDWPDCYGINRFVKGVSGETNVLDVLRQFARWPTWMWANHEIASLARWLRAHNELLPPPQRVGFYGLDVYSLWESMAVVVAYLDRVAPEASQQVQRAYECFAPFGEDEQLYAHATLAVPMSCEEEVVRSLVELRRQAPRYTQRDERDAYFDAEQNALTVKNAERYYRAMVRGDAESWNVRDLHMVETLERLMAFHGPEAKAILWEHNTHVGDARFTDMTDQGEVNVGQLMRERHGREGVVLVGFSTYEGTVIAGEEWSSPIRRMTVPSGRAGSWEDVLHRLGRPSALFIYGDATPLMLERRGHRAIGVVYRPQFERFGNYVPTVMPRRYDALLFIDRSRALSPLHTTHPLATEVPETFPSGM